MKRCIETGLAAAGYLIVLAVLFAIASPFGWLAQNQPVLLVVCIASAAGLIALAHLELQLEARRAARAVLPARPATSPRAAVAAAATGDIEGA